MPEWNWSSFAVGMLLGLVLGYLGLVLIAYLFREHG
jgi:hypothetical protein